MLNYATKYRQMHQIFPEYISSCSDVTLSIPRTLIQLEPRKDRADNYGPSRLVFHTGVPVFNLGNIVSSKSDLFGRTSYSTVQSMLSKV
jgi:hypothetical protein